MSLMTLEEAQCPYAMSGMADSNVLDTLAKALTTVPQSQQDVHQIASAVQYAQTPQAQQQFQQIESGVEMYLYAQMAFQVVATMATFGIFLMMLNKFVKERQ